MNATTTIVGRNDKRHTAYSGRWHVTTDNTGAWELWDAAFSRQPGPRGLPVAHSAGEGVMGYGPNVLNDCRGEDFVADTIEAAVEKAEAIAARRTA